MTTGLFIGRFAPAHKGHINAIMRMLNTYDRIVIGLGSCYDVGSKRAPLLAIFREKMLLLSILEMGGDLSKVTICHIPDYISFDAWLRDVLEICKIYNVTHFISGNNEEIIDVFKEKYKDLPFELVNPEEGSQEEFHASDLRRAVVEGDYDTFNRMAAPGTRMLLCSFDGFNRIRTSNDNNGRMFHEGPQSVDIVFTMQEKIIPESKVPYLKTYALVGKRPKNSKDFPSYPCLVGGRINKFESPIAACLRILKNKTGLVASLKSNICEPSVITIESDNGPIISELAFLQLYNDKVLAGEEGGSSQCFTINIYGSPQLFNEKLKNSSYKFVPVHEINEQKMAYEHHGMFKDAVGKLSHYAE